MFTKPYTIALILIMLAGEVSWGNTQAKTPRYRLQCGDG